MKKNNFDKKTSSNQTFSKHEYNLEKGWVYWFEPVKEVKIDNSPLVVILSNDLHNELADHIIVALVSGKNMESISPTFEVYCEVEKRQLKVLISEIHTISKEVFFGKAIYLGKMKKEQLEAVNQKIELILQLNS